MNLLKFENKWFDRDQVKTISVLTYPLQFEATFGGCWSVRLHLDHQVCIEWVYKSEPLAHEAMERLAALLQSPPTPQPAADAGLAPEYFAAVWFMQFLKDNVCMDARLKECIQGFVDKHNSRAGGGKV